MNRGSFVSSSMKVATLRPASSGLRVAMSAGNWIAADFSQSMAFCNWERYLRSPVRVK